ncbi:MAG: DnaD domain protein [Clostridiales bacterium]|nr:DnaD domain protein [Clostridiales bacterium]
MSYCVNPAALGAVFMVPCQVVDQHIKLAGAVQLKALLWILRHVGEPIDVEKMADALSLPAVDLSDALTYWVEAGLLTSLEPAVQPVPPLETPPAAAATDRAAGRAGRPAPAAVKPGREEVAKRGLESPEIAFLLKEAQMKFGRGLRQNEASTLVWLHDDEGLGAAVILMLIEFAVSEGRCNIGFIERTALDWISRGIVSIEQAERRICEIHNQRTAWRKVERAMGIDHRMPTVKELQNAYTWVEDWGFSSEMLRAAYEECVDNTAKVSMAYIGRVLENWHKRGVSSPEAAAAAKTVKARREKKEQKSYAGYDMDLAQRMLEMENEG